MQLDDIILQRDKEIEAYTKKTDEKSRALVVLKTSTLWFMHEVALLEREKSQLISLKQQSGAKW